MGRIKNYNRVKLIQALMQLFWKNEIEKIGLSQIEEVTGVNKSGLYREFLNKEDMLLQTMIYYKDKANNHIVNISQNYEGLKAIQTFLELTLKQDGCYFFRLMTSQTSLNKEAKKLLKQYVKTINSFISDKLEQENMNKKYSQIIVNFDIGICQKALYGENKKQIKQEINEFIDFLKNR